MNLANELKQVCTVKNTKGGNYFATTYDCNLDFFASISRYNKKEKIQNSFSCALAENKTLALANLLYTLDIKDGKGERRIFKEAFNYLCKNDVESAKTILPFIGKMGRYDYILKGLNTPFEEEVIKLIKKTLEKDLLSNNPSLLAKWLPSHKNNHKNSSKAKHIMCKMNMNEATYRKTLSSIRKKLNLVETNLTKKEYEHINYEHVPTKAMLKYKEAFKRNDSISYNEYLSSLVKQEKKVNTNGLFVYEVIRNIYRSDDKNDVLLDAMWTNQKDLLKGKNTNVLVVADTSGSMMNYGGLPYFASIGLALYTAERNTGLFKDMFITFSRRPTLQIIKGKTISEKVKSIKSIVDNTNIDRVFKLILDTMVNNNGSQEDLPSHILIISDMEFDEGVYSQNKTNLKGWKKAFNEHGFILPKVVFWNVAANSYGCPITKYENDVIMISGFSTNLLENIFDIENYDPVEYMKKTLNKYVIMLEKESYN